MINTIAAFSSWLWTTFGAPMANHLWQSTLFMGAAELLVLVLRKNQARTRYWLWLAVSVKFLLPFSLLVGLGSYLPWSRVSARAQTEFSSVAGEIGQPFQPAGSGHAIAAAIHGFAVMLRILPALLFLVWLIGVVSVTYFWWRRWQRLDIAIRRTSPVTSGRELERLRRLERRKGISRGIELVISESSLEPGIAGIFRPVLLLPAGISDRLTDLQLEAILDHELCHVCRRDNLSAAIHMFVEALFWFHPLVWWIGSRLVDERERACDEEVLRQGNDPQVYAESILKVCRFYLESPLFCAAGVTGSNLKKRIEAIMNDRIASKLNWGKKLFLATAGALAVIAPVVFGVMNPTGSQAEEKSMAGSSTLEIVSVIPSETTESRFFIDTKQGIAQFTGFSLKDLIKFAYDLNDAQIAGGPDWVSSTRYDIREKGPAENSFNFTQVKLSVQKLVGDQFKLNLHREVKELQVYDLAIADKDGLKLKETASAPAPGGNRIFGQRIKLGPPGHMVVQQFTMESLAGALSKETGRVIQDKTGLKGFYDFTLDWPMPSADITDAISTVLPEQLGLQLSPHTEPVEVLVIDHAEEIASNN
jgi:uncharacterized protein (TIGR03435 family)